MNMCCFTGNLVADAKQVFETDQGKILIAFTLAVSTPRMANGKWTNDAMFIKCSKYAGKGLLPHLLKGRPVAVDGVLKQNKWSGDDGKMRSEHQLMCTHLDLTAKKGQHDNYGQSRQDNYNPDEDYTDPHRYASPPNDEENRDWNPPAPPQESQHQGNQNDVLPDIMF